MWSGRFAPIGVAIACWSCAGMESPREPYASSAGTAIEAPESERPAFRVLEEWDWTQTIDAPELGPAEAALEQRRLGLFPARRFRLATGECADCRAPEAVLWWFRDALIAVPEAEWVLPDATLPPDPPLVWLGAPHVVEDARLASDAEKLETGGTALPLDLTPRIPTNEAYVDATTAEFFGTRPLRARGAARLGADGVRFVARTLWPQDARLDAESIRLEPLAERQTLGTLIEAQTNGVASPFHARLLFERAPGEPRRWAGRTALAFVLSGAQSSDDGSRAGHLAVATGTLGEDGEWSDWLVNNFYPIVDRSAKGIIPGPVPMDNYLLDLNSGQLYYRPAYMLVAVLRRPRAAHAVQAALQQMMLRYYCREVDFDIATFNSTAMTMDPLRELGWRIPFVGPTSRLAALAAAPATAVAELSLARAADVYAALAAEKTRILPRVAFEVAGHDLLALAAGPSSRQEELTRFERVLAEDVEALVFVRLPQVPSARPFGTYPVRSLLGYGAWVLSAPMPFETAPDAGTREFPDRLARSCAHGAKFASDAVIEGGQEERRMGKQHGSSVKDDRQYEKLRDQGMSKEKAARVANTSRRQAGSRGGKAARYEDWSKQDLYDKAKDVGIEGRSRMSKSDLVDALRNH